jgi:hypothetical protein
MGFGVDNIDLSLGLVPAERFDVKLTEGIMAPLNNTLGFGAGVLENRGARDVFALSVDRGADLYLDWQTSSSGVGWSLIKLDGTIAASGLSSGGDVTVRDLNEEMRLEVYAAGSRPATVQAYGLSALWVPAAQEFGLDLGSGPVTVSNASLGAGSGNLETKASMDQYAFTVPEGGSRTVIDFLQGASQFSPFLAWEVLDADGQQVKSGLLNATGGRRFDQHLDAGDYRLRITAQYEYFGTYSLRAYLSTS